MANKAGDWHRFVWKIENFSYCWHKKSECISSPKFYMEGYSWCLQIFSCGNCNDDDIACYLLSDNLINRKVNLKLTFMDFDGASLKEWISKDGLHFSKNRTYGTAYFTSRNDVFVDRRMKFLPNDTLTVGCHISPSEYSTSIQKVFARTHIEVHWETITQKIPDFSFFRSYGNRSFAASSSSQALKYNFF